MSGVAVALITIALMLVLIYAGLHVAIALLVLSFAGVWMLRDSFDIAANMMVLAFKDSISDYLFGVVPLFVLMGLVVAAAGIGRDAFDVAHQAFRRVRGGLGIGTVVANAIFAAITGISIASAAVFSKLAVPEMRRRGYTKSFSVGVVAGSSVLGMLLPPSLLFILYGVLTEQSVGALFVAGILPGLLLTVIYSLGILLAARVRPNWVGGTLPDDDDTPLMSGAEIARKMAPIILLVALVMGGIYGGIFTPTEAGAAGAFAATLIAIAKRRITWRVFRDVLIQTGHTTAAVCFLILSASLYSRMLAMSGLPSWLGAQVMGAGLDASTVVLLVALVMIALGTILDSSSIMLLVIPIAYPVLTALNVDLIWFGVLVILAVEIGLLTPPFGIAVFVVKAALGPTSDITLWQIFKGAAPFALAMVGLLLLVFFFPSLATALL
ncbi:TRAP transporter large permease [Pararhodobacter zhoushanensis]|uniref:TRAP transporter large permease n=1 Tax=Pararhodobacter zhoushanensis TaxID=2479545 RepID=UPI000F8C997E|nr:TRAP transporter large permease [Pararhodobacter zhoushanensis]